MRLLNDFALGDKNTLMYATLITRNCFRVVFIHDKYFTMLKGAKVHCVETSPKHTRRSPNNAVGTIKTAFLDMFLVHRLPESNA